MKREDGYYWIKMSYAEWEPAEWWSDTENWWLTGISEPYTEDEISEVGERIIKK